MELLLSRQFTLTSLVCQLSATIIFIYNILEKLTLIEKKLQLLELFYQGALYQTRLLCDLTSMMKLFQILKKVSTLRALQTSTKKR